MTAGTVASRSAAVVRWVFSSPMPRRSVTLAVTERLSAVTPLASSLEYLARGRDRAPGGLNNWAVMRRSHLNRPAWVLGVLDVVADRRTTNALHAVRTASALVLLLGPAARRPRLAASSVLAATSALLADRHHFGADGSDQVSLLVQAAGAVARAGQRHPETVDACLWFIALQSVLSYTASGWAKLTSSSWRSGEALTGIMRTEAYGHRAAWQALRRHPHAARSVCAGVLTMECLFPAVFAGRGRVARPLVASAAAFHLANGRLMGLGRFVWSFIAMHPAVLYAAGRPDARPGPDGRLEPARDDLLPAVAATLAAALFTAGLIAQARRRRAVLRVREDECTVRTSSGNVLTYRSRGPAGTDPVIVLEAGLMAGPESLEWLARDLAGRWQTVTYWRAGYGSSRCARAENFVLGTRVQDLTDLARHVGKDRSVILAGHSLGGYLCFLAASHLGLGVRGVCLLDSSHPAELVRSPSQARGADHMAAGMAQAAASLRFGLGELLRPPPWAGRLPAEAHGSAMAQYRDARQWQAARREWRAAERHFAECDGKLPVIDASLLVITASETAANDPVQKELHDDFAQHTPSAESHVLSGTTHDSMLMDSAAAHRVAQLSEAFIGRLTASADRGEQR